MQIINRIFGRMQDNPKKAISPRLVARKIHHLSGTTMGTRYQISFVAHENTELSPIATEVDQAVQAVDQAMSTWKPDSPLSQFNRSPTGDWCAVPADLVTVVKEGLRLSQITGGAFDITLGAAVNIWGFGPEHDTCQIADPTKHGKSQQSNGWAHLQTRNDPPALCKTADFKVDLSGIAKGFGVDQIARALEALHIDNYCVTIDGEARIAGRKPGKLGPWALGLDAPDPGQKSIRDILTPPQGSVATSGDYRNFFMYDGQRYAHTIDGATGAPLQNNLRSVTVWQPDCMMADAWATALLVMGPERGLAMAQARHIPALFLMRNGDGLEEIFTGDFAAMLAG